LFALNDGVYAGLGIDSLGNSHNDLWKYNEIGNEWIALPGIPALGRRGGVCLATQDGMYYITGIDEGNNRLTEHWMYSPIVGLEIPTGVDQRLIGSFDLLGRPNSIEVNQIVLDYYANGTVKKRFQWVP
jgi:hypothetical protein